MIESNRKMKNKEQCGLCKWELVSEPMGNKDTFVARGLKIVPYVEVFSDILFNSILYSVFFQNRATTNK